MRREPEVARRPGHNGQPEQTAPARFEREFPLRQVLREDGSADPSEVLLPDAEVKRLYRWMVLNRELDRRMTTL